MNHLRHLVRVTNSFEGICEIGNTMHVYATAMSTRIEKGTDEALRLSSDR
jgi:hypothetical protein